MTDKPLLFSGPMVRALLEGRKTQTRRILKIRGHKTFSFFGPSDTAGYDWHLRDSQRRWHDLRDAQLRQRLGYEPGDLIWVRETFNQSGFPWPNLAQGLGRLHYQADPDHGWQPYWGRWRPSIHMPRWASRLTLLVTDVRVQRLQDISEADAVAEGCRGFVSADGEDGTSPREEFQDLWNSLNADRGYGWEANPWVCALTFEVHQGNIEKVAA